MNARLFRSRLRAPQRVLKSLNRNQYYIVLCECAPFRDHLTERVRNFPSSEHTRTRNISNFVMFSHKTRSPKGPTRDLGERVSICYVTTGRQCADGRLILIVLDGIGCPLRVWCFLSHSLMIRNTLFVVFHVLHSGTSPLPVLVKDTAWRQRWPPLLLERANICLLPPCFFYEERHT